MQGAASDFFLKNKKKVLSGRVFGNQGSLHKIDGSFIATLLETAAVGVLYLAWDSITEGVCFLIPLKYSLQPVLKRLRVSRIMGR